MKGLHVLFSHAADAMGIAPFYTLGCKYKKMHSHIHPVPENGTFFRLEGVSRHTTTFPQVILLFRIRFFFFFTPFIPWFEDVTQRFCRHSILVFVRND